MNLMVSSITFLKVIGHLHWNPLVGKGAASINRFAAIVKHTIPVEHKGLESFHSKS